MSIKPFLKRPPGHLRIPGNPYPIYRPNHVGGSKSCVGFTFLSYTGLQTQSRLYMSGITNIRSRATLHGPHQVHSATTMHRLDTHQTCRLSTWADDYPEVHNIQVKSKGKNADWEDVKAIVTLHRDKRGRARRVWTPFSGDSTRKKDLAVEWPEGKQATTTRKLRDPEEFQHDDDGLWDDDDDDDILNDEAGDGKDTYTVMEKLDVYGQRFWREVIAKGAATAEEVHLSWEDMMEEEGFNAELDRQMGKYP